MERKSTVICSILSLILLVNLFSCFKDDSVKQDKDSRTIKRSVSENMAYPDTYPEWGSIGQNRPKTSVNESYSPDPINILKLAFSNPVNDDPINGLPSPYIHLQWRKLDVGYLAMSKWYSYHPFKRGYDTLRIDTLTEEYHPSQGQWFFNVNPKLFPTGPIQFRTRLLYPPLDTMQKGSASLWSTNYGIVFNQFGDPNWAPGEFSGSSNSVTANVDMSLDVDIINNTPKSITSIFVTAFGGGPNYYYPQSFLSAHGLMSVNVEIGTAKSFTNAVSIKVYLSDGTDQTFTHTFTHWLTVYSSTPPSPAAFYMDGMAITIN